MLIKRNCASPVTVLGCIYLKKQRIPPFGLFRLGVAERKGCPHLLVSLVWRKCCNNPFHYQSVKALSSSFCWVPMPELFGLQFGSRVIIVCKQNVPKGNTRRKGFSTMIYSCVFFFSCEVIV